MKYRLLDPETMKREWFETMIELEEGCGLEPYTPDMLFESIALMDTIAAFSESGELTGFITCLRSDMYSPGGLYIVNINVGGRHRRQGIGESLMRIAAEMYRANGGKGLISLDVTRTNKPACALYQKLGFEKTGIPSRNGAADDVLMAPCQRLLMKEKQE